MRDNLLWEEDRTSLMIINKGVYNIKVVIFTDELNISITLVINGENLVVKNSEKNKDNIVHNNKFSYQKICIDEDININDKVRVAILFSGKSINAKGFMKISTVHYEQEKDCDIKNAKAVEERLGNNNIDISDNININVNINQNKTFPPLIIQENAENSQVV